MEGRPTVGPAEPTVAPQPISPQRDTGTFRAVSVQRGGFLNESGEPAVSRNEESARPEVEAPTREESKSDPFRSYFFIGTLIFIICGLIVLLLVLWLGQGLEAESARLGVSTQPTMGAR
ncbi:hypothetical protein ACN4D1_06485 [Corynebacterium macclintockiae]|uniref:Uncharacterized protein n=1 Tax=Corynebacterium macclintockiae TaxID=2913501 RepID=A0A9X3RS33_9CORY|nr:MULTISPECIES: hypothetical protein [Corynebacterium]MCZ9305647.1 hypothetical protein [Corynebacterium macclintockiae]OFM59037.1 hypothetical protein HMPREF2678_07560 [Corynebacterium sp. HMSC058E07]